jgi:hypothetical protein
LVVCTTRLVHYIQHGSTKCGYVWFFGGNAHRCKIFAKAANFTASEQDIVVIDLILNSLWTSSKRDSRYNRTALVYYCIHIEAYIQGLYTVYNGAGVQGTVAVLELAGNQGRRQPVAYRVLLPC